MPALTAPAYAELYCLSNFSFLRGASHPEELVRQAHVLGYRALALTDECTLAGAVRAHVAARALGMQLIIGSELILDDGTRLLFLADTLRAYQRLATLITRGRRRQHKGAYQLERADLVALGDAGLVILLPQMEAADADAAAWVSAQFQGRAWLGLGLFYSGRDGARLAYVEALGQRYGVPLVAVGEVHMHCHARRPVLDTVTAIRLGTTESHLVPSK